MVSNAVIGPSATPDLTLTPPIRGKEHPYGWYPGAWSNYSRPPYKCYSSYEDEVKFRTHLMALARGSLSPKQSQYPPVCPPVQRVSNQRTDDLVVTHTQSNDVSRSFPTRIAARNAKFQRSEGQKKHQMLDWHPHYPKPDVTYFPFTGAPPSASNKRPSHLVPNLRGGSGLQSPQQTSLQNQESLNDASNGRPKTAPYLIPEILTNGLGNEGDASQKPQEISTTFTRAKSAYPLQSKMQIQVPKLTLDSNGDEKRKEPIIWKSPKQTPLLQRANSATCNYMTQKVGASMIGQIPTSPQRPFSGSTLVEPDPYSYLPLGCTKRRPLAVPRLIPIE